MASGVVFSTTPAQPATKTRSKLATTSRRHSARRLRHPRQLVPLLALQTAAPLREDSQGARGRRKTGRSGGRPQSAGGICSRPAETAVDVHLSAPLLAMENTMCVVPPHGAGQQPLVSLPHPPLDPEWRSRRQVCRRGDGDHMAAMRMRARAKARIIPVADRSLLRTRSGSGGPGFYGTPLHIASSTS